MKRLLRRLLASALLAPAVLSAASFEGKVSFTLTSGGGKPQELSYQIKGDKIRMELPGQKGMGGVIVDTTKKETTVLMDEQKMYMVMAMPDVAAQAAQQARSAGTLEQTGEKEKILGYDAGKYISTYQETRTELWLAEGLGTFMAMPSANPMGGARPPAPSWERALAGKDLFPLRVIGRDKDGKETFRMETSAITPQSLPDTLFTPPAAYQKLDMGGMMKGMMPGGFPGSR